ncbi:MAG: hypothetical protein EAZ95_17830 [Bacteroidetes bacterium]|nr:MAG: hypothetical protein EAZ95_17830 [Bacteroidota bacterium]
MCVDGVGEGRLSQGQVGEQGQGFESCGAGVVAFEGTSQVGESAQHFFFALGMTWQQVGLAFGLGVW